MSCCCRPLQEIFLAGVAILQKLVAEEAHALLVARAAGGTYVKQWEGIGALIGRKMDMERKYIARLEGGWRREGAGKAGVGGRQHQGD
jgi:hypothetical protein